MAVCALAGDLPSNVSRVTLKSTKFPKQLKDIPIKRYIQIFEKTIEDGAESPMMLSNLQQRYHIKMQDKPMQKKIVALDRFEPNQCESISLDAYIEQRKEDQNQIFFLGKCRSDK